MSRAELHIKVKILLPVNHTRPLLLMMDCWVNTHTYTNSMRKLTAPCKGAAKAKAPGRICVGLRNGFGLTDFTPDA